jgi:hypothetical protein
MSGSGVVVVNMACKYCKLCLRPCSNLCRVWQAAGGGRQYSGAAKSRCDGVAVRRCQVMHNVEANVVSVATASVGDAMEYVY